MVAKLNVTPPKINSDIPIMKSISVGVKVPESGIGAVDAVAVGVGVADGELVGVELGVDTKAGAS